MNIYLLLFYLFSDFMLAWSSFHTPLNMENSLFYFKTVNLLSVLTKRLLLKFSDVTIDIQ